MYSKNTVSLGIGTNRLPIKNAEDEDGLEKSARLIAKALDMGCSYIDVAPSYSKGMAEKAAKLAFSYTDAPKNVTLKCSYSQNKTAEDAIKCAKTSLQNMGLSKASYFVVWGIKSYNEFLELSKKGALLDGAKECKKQGLVEHICFSTHAPVDDIIKILESGEFEGVTISMSALNFLTMEKVVKRAEELNIGIVIMNPLGGGIIPQNKEYFSFIANENENTVEASLRLLKAYTGINIILSGISSEAELLENINALKKDDCEKSAERIERVKKSFCSIEGFCTGCNYCAGCPVGIPISSIMQSRNAALYPATASYNQTEPELVKDIQVFRKLNLDYSVMPENSNNPCIKCGACEKKCTQHLRIMDSLDEFYKKCEQRSYSKTVQQNRLNEILKTDNYKKVAFYPAGGYLHKVLEFSKIDVNYELIGFDSNPDLWGKTINNIPVFSPDTIPEHKPDIIVIMNYNYQKEIYESIKKYEYDGIRIEKLHKKDDIPWVF